MNFVIFSMEFLPHRGAESWCTSRFAGALAYCGHNVHVVTLDHRGIVDPDVWDVIVGDKVKVTRVKTHAAHKPILARVQYLTYEWEAVDFSACIATVKQILKERPDAVLVTRSNPLASTIVGWHCRKCAKKWVAHLSDPIPIPGREESWRNLHGYVNRFWMRRVFRDADLVSVTCPNAIRAFKDEYGNITSRVKFVVVPHIGEPALRKSDAVSSENSSFKHIVHHGVMCLDRGGPELAESVRRLNTKGIRCDFVQCGQVDDVKALFGQDSLVRQETSCVSDVEYIPDLKVPLPYCPFLSSKFVYRLYDDKPILLYTNQDSMSAELARRYSGAGIFVANNTVPESIDCALRDSMLCTSDQINRESVRKEFSRMRIAEDFVSELANLDCARYT